MRASWEFTGRGEQTGLLVAAAITPGTFVPSLVPRSTLDQGIVTGLATSVSYVLTVAAQDLIEAAAGSIADRVPGRSATARQRNAALLLDLAVVPAGVLVHRVVSRLPAERTRRGLARQVAWRLAATGVGGVTFAVVEAGAERLDARLGAGGRLARFPVAVPIGFAVAAVVEARRRRQLAEVEPGGDEPQTAPAKAVATAAAVAAGLFGAAYGEHLAARGTGRLLAATLPGPPRLWRLAAHGACLGALTAVGTAVFHYAMVRVEAGATTFEPLLDDAAGRRWVGPTISGGNGSLVSWDAIGREGRRHAFGYVRPAPVSDRPAGLPDLSIQTVMGEPARATPIQVYVGLDCGSTARERVDLALAEMDRTDAWERSLIMLVSPTGTGYVNYCATAAVEYLTLGDVATVTLQYSKRPSPLSLGKVKDAREQNRLLWLQILARLRERPDHRPRVVLFGESLGALTSQDVLMHWGTLGPQALGIERALWIGTPYLSKWMKQVTGPARPDVDPGLFVMVNDFAQIEAMPPERRAQLRYVMVSHDSDGVTKFGPDLIVSRPAWLGPQRPRMEAVPGASPRGVPARIRWRPVTSFLQTMIDMKNAQIPGAYRSWAHDYRPDLARFISEVYDLPASKERLDRIERALQEREEVRERILAAESLDPLRDPAHVADPRTTRPAT